MKILAIAIAAALLTQQDKVTLKFNPKKGDKLVRTEKNEMQLKAKIVAGEQTQDIEMEQKGSEKAVLEYQEVADGKVTKLLIDQQEDVEEKKEPGSMEWTKEEKPMHGRKVTLELKDGKIVRTGVDGLDEKALKKLDLEDQTVHLLPKQAVAVGDTWKVEGEDVKKFMRDDELSSGTITMKLLEVKEIDKRRCAVLNAVLDVSGKTDNDVEVAAKLDCEVVIWIERGYALSVKGKGKVTMKAANEQFKMDGEGPITLDISVKVE
jgi:hypothetical protein